MLIKPFWISPPASAKDDAAGQAIANRMTSQITGLAQAQRNANDGISVAQTAEGALNQVNDNLQRIRELSVQAQNDTNSANDLQSIQDEIGQRLAEIDRISQETDFNGVKVLNTNEGVSIQVGANDGETISVNLQTINAETLGLATFNVQKAADVEISNPLSAVGGDMVDVQANEEIDLDPLSGLTGDLTAEGVVSDGTITYVNITSTVASESGLYEANVGNDGTVTITGTTAATVAPDLTSVDLDAFAANASVGGVVEDSTAAGTYYVEIENSDTGAENGFYLATIDNTTGEITITGSVQATVPNESAVTNINKGTDSTTEVTQIAGAGAQPVSFATDTATAAIDTPKLVTVTDADGNETYAIQDASGALFAADVNETNGEVAAKTVSYTDSDGAVQTGTVRLGGIDGVTEYVAVGETNYSAAKLDGSDLQTETVEQVAMNGTTNPLAALDDALKQVDSLRSELGAVQNRFESAITNLQTNETNLSAARSRIEDADYAVEVANMTRAQILQQAGTSVLAQANQIPQNVLSLLG